MQYPKRVYAKIDLDRIESNIEIMHKNIHTNTKMMVVIKADGYGHGSVPIARMLSEKEYVEGFCVATVEEAILLRKNAILNPILVLGYVFPEQYEEVATYGITIPIFREDNLSLLNACGKRNAKKMKVHIKVDTGMGRIGIRPDESGISFVKKLMEYEYIEPEGIFTHFARADETDLSYTKKQFESFSSFVKELKEEYLVPIQKVHCSNSAAIFQMPEANLDLVRPGITTYGLSPSPDVNALELGLRPAMSIYSHIVFIKDVNPGESISYGGTYVASEKRRIATIPVGYGDGYPRSLSNKGYVLVNGKKAPIVGRVCMDQFMIDVTDIPDAKEDCDVVLLGKDKDNEIFADEIGELSSRFNYEFVCDLGKRIPRVFLRHGVTLTV